MKILHLGHLNQGGKHVFLSPFKYQVLAGLGQMKYSGSKGPSDAGAPRSRLLCPN